MKEKKKLPLAVKILLGIILSALLVVVGYFLYLLLSYHRIEDNVKLEINSPKTQTELAKVPQHFAQVPETSEILDRMHMR